MKRAIVMAISVILALAVAAPIASGQPPSQRQDLQALTEKWQTWAIAVPSPLDGDYKGGQQCEGEFVEGVFFLAGTTGGDAKRTCTVPARTALFFPAINYFCTADEVDIYPECAAEVTDTALANGSPYATLDRKNLEMSRIATGPFTLIIPEDNIFGVPRGPYPFPAVSDGLWVYLPKGLEPGNQKVEFGGASVDPRGVPFSLNVTYKLKVV